ncbi:MAG: amino acid ABC transporter substrate-binding protein [Gammaproteobacteria bacterium]|nr:MAG: amino acid ABC transporter substrate-binding protein [Gammaproteobacteria bacterium]
MIRLGSAAFAVLCGVLPVFAQAGVLDDVRARGTLRCGVNADLPGFSQTNSLGEYSGFDIDVCRAVATTVLGKDAKVEFVPVTTTERFDQLNADRFDLLSRNTTWTLERDVLHGDFAGVTFYDGQGFLVKRKTGIRSALELDNKTVCVSRGTTTEENAIDFFAVSDMRYRPVYFEDGADAAQAYKDGKCVALTSDRSALAGYRASFDNPQEHIVLGEIISKEPLGPMVAPGDEAWTALVRWTVNCLITAEELGIDSSNVGKLSRSATPEVRRVLGIEGETGKLLGVEQYWCANVIAAVGNYGEIYDKHVGPDSALGLERGVNTLWTNGGLLYSPPIR